MVVTSMAKRPASPAAGRRGWPSTGGCWRHGCRRRWLHNPRRHAGNGIQSLHHGVEPAAERIHLAVKGVELLLNQLLVLNDCCSDFGVGRLELLRCAGLLGVDCA